MNGCKINSCDQLIPSMCVLYTGELSKDSSLNLDCNANLNDVIFEIDSQLIKLLGEYGIPLIDINTANACNIQEFKDLNTNSTYRVSIDKARTTSTVVQLIKVVCDLHDRVTTLEDECCWGSPLKDIDLHCLPKIYDDPCGGVNEIKTYKDLLQALIIKLCQ